MGNQRENLVTAEIRDDQKRNLKIIAKKEERTVASCIRIALKEYLEKNSHLLEGVNDEN